MINSAGRRLLRHGQAAPPLAAVSAVKMAALATVDVFVDYQQRGAVTTAELTHSPAAEWTPGQNARV